MRQQLADLTRPLRRQACQHVLEIGIRIMPVHAGRLDQAHDRRRAYEQKLLRKGLCMRMGGLPYSRDHSG